MPEIGEIDPSVRFLVRVAADVFTLDSDIAFSPSQPLAPPDFTGDAGVHVTHHVVELIHIDARGTEIGAAATDRILRIRVGTPEFAGWTYLHTGAAQPTNVRFDVEGSADTAVFASPAESDGLGHHLFLAHAHAPTAEDAVLVLLTKPLLPHVVRRREVLNRLRLRA
jgi:hypothetical protein